MHGFGLLLGHLVGDYILQDDWQAANKTDLSVSSLRMENWEPLTGHTACAIHCTLYTLSVWLFSFTWMPWWGLLAVWVAHFPVDRWRLARRWMMSGLQQEFATGPLAPWSVILVDNIAHLLVLYVIGGLCLGF